MNSESIRPGFERDGFVFPLKAMEESEARAYRQLLETVEAEHCDNPDYVYAINGGVNFILPPVDEITAIGVLLLCRYRSPPRDRRHRKSRYRQVTRQIQGPRILDPPRRAVNKVLARTIHEVA